MLNIDTSIERLPAFPIYLNCLLGFWKLARGILSGGFVLQNVKLFATDAAGKPGDSGEPGGPVDAPPLPGDSSS